MASSVIAKVKEELRQKLNDDSHFLKRLLYFFELRIPAEVGVFGDTDFLFPLIIPPENYVLEEPFTLEATPTDGGGLTIEENGIVQRTIRLRGHTGFRPRTVNLRTSIGPVPSTLPANRQSHSRVLPWLIFGALSGQRHFQYLQDSVFRTYADLKRDPAYSKDTTLIFHNPKDGEHWIVAPQRFTLERDSSSPMLYRYNIELLVVDKAEAKNADFSEDKSIFDQIKDALRDIKSAIDYVTGAINDVTALLAEIKAFVNDISKIIDAVTSILTACTDFVNGVTDLITAPYAMLISTLEMIDEGLNVLGNAADVPETVVQKLRQVADGVERIGIHSGLFENPTEKAIREIRDFQENRRTMTSEEIEELAAEAHPTTFAEYKNLGTGLTPGDAQSIAGEITTGGSIQGFQSARQIVVQEGDTLVSLSAKHLGDARLWQQIAVVNNLKPPFTDQQASAPLVASESAGSQTSGKATGADESPFPHALGIGSKILIPSKQKAIADQPLLPVIGVQLEESTEVHFLGTDLKLEAVTDLAGSSRALYDVPIDTELGSVDAQMVSGMDNLGQMIITRLLTDYGTDILYKKVGIRRVAGLGFTDIDLETARFRILESLEGDPRIARIQSLKLEQRDIDSLFVDADVQIRGLTESRNIRAMV